jgi:hypothetical protein
LERSFNEAGPRSFSPSDESGGCEGCQSWLRAKSRRLTIGDEVSYAATLARFADAFGDKHVRSRPVLEAARPDWTGPEFIKTFDD